MVFTAKRQTFSLGKTDPLRALTHTAQNLEGDSLYAFCFIFVSICFVVYCCVFLCFVAFCCALLRCFFSIMLHFVALPVALANDKGLTLETSVL